MKEIDRYLDVLWNLLGGTAILCIIVATILTACQPKTVVTETATADTPGLPNGITRFIDKEAGIVCYKYSGANVVGAVGGISCLPLDQTRLGK